MKTNKYRFWNCRLVELSESYVTVALFVLPLAAHGYQPEIVYEFGGTNGFQPNGLIQASDGNFYGTTARGGNANYGTVFRLTTNGVLTTLWSFGNTNSAYPTTNGAYPTSGLLQARDGNFYGTTAAGGNAYGDGTVFRLTPNGTVTTLTNFGPPNGSTPSGALIEASDGYLYGTTVYGGSDDAGTIFRLMTNGDLTTLYHSFITNGAFPYGGMIQASDGNFYGTTRNTTSSGNGYGTVFLFATNGVLTTLATFDLFNTGGTIYSGLVQADDGNLYGTTLLGGNPAGIGTVFKLTLAGQLTWVVSFGSSNGGRPYSRLIQASDGNLYGTTQWSPGLWDYGTVFQLTTNGQLTTLFSFTSAMDSPSAPLIQAADGNLYGTTSSGGKGYGTVYRVITRPTLASPPADTTNVVGGWAVLSVVANGAPPLQYQWQRDDTNLLDDDRILGTANANLELAPLNQDDAGCYRVIVRNGFGVVTSTVANLSVELPPTFSAIRRLMGDDHAVELSLSASSSFAWAIEASTNLLDWVTLTNNLMINGTIQFKDESAADFPERFYRTTLEP
jgi:uncharacterized repeat protein (TIGR03803 family)